MKPGEKARPGGRRQRPLSEKEREFVRNVGASIKAKRFEKQIAGESLGRAIGITGAAQFRRESGDVSFPLEDLHRYAEALGCSPGDLLPQFASTLEDGTILFSGTAEEGQQYFARYFKELDEKKAAEKAATEKKKPRRKFNFNV